MYGQIITSGIILSLVFSELTGLSPAGLIVPGYLALSASSPLKIVWTIAVSFITLGIYRIIESKTILYGKRRFAVMVIISMILGWILSALPIPYADAGVVGYLIPGIIAKEFDRQGIIRTLIPMTAVTAMVILVSFVLGIQLF